MHLMNRKSYGSRSGYGCIRCLPSPLNAERNKGVGIIGIWSVSDVCDTDWSRPLIGHDRVYHSLRSHGLLSSFWIALGGVIASNYDSKRHESHGYSKNSRASDVLLRARLLVSSPACETMCQMFGLLTCSSWVLAHQWPITATHAGFQVTLNDPAVSLFIIRW